MIVLIDSWAWVEYWKGSKYSEVASKYIEGEDQAIVSAINLAEVYHWILRSYDERIAERKRATIEKRCFVIPVDRTIAIEAAKIKRGQGLALADSLILATARISGAKVVTGDEDFRQLPETIFIGE
ncbi:MAG: type II toxin-antitoxin system VapC family toxin [Candidatus Brockarchaeota archaeon]|nr:type II toxin-antitoxin system VapC family toxin [Candidatus Brockarchaeota archaeon]